MEGGREWREDMETSMDMSSPQGYGGAKRFLEGEHVEVLQREKGLRGSWHPAVVIGVEPGRRLVEYDELLTDDGREKLTENIPVGKCVDGGRPGAARQPWKSPAKRPRALLRPRPPPLPDPLSISWVKGLSVDCHFRDAWWEGVLTEAFDSCSRHKRAAVWFPEEEDRATMPVKDMRVGQKWDEETCVWRVKGCVEIPVSRRGNRARTMSLGKESKGFARKQRDLQLALRTDDWCRAGREMEYTSAWKNTDRTLDEADAVISVQLNSPTSTVCTQRQAKLVNGAGTDRSSEDDLKDQRPLVVRTRSLALSFSRLPTSPRGGSREESLSTGASSGEEKDNAGGVSKHKSVYQGGVVVRDRSRSSGGTVDKSNWYVKKPTLSRGARMKNAQKGKETRLADQLEDSSRDVELGDNADLLQGGDDEDRKRLHNAGWEVTLSVRKNGKRQWYYRSPGGRLLGSLTSARMEWNSMTEAGNKSSADNENPTLNDMKSPKSRKGSTFSKGRPGYVRLTKGSEGVAIPGPLGKEGSPEMDQPEPCTGGDMICKLGPPAGSNGTLKSSSTEDSGFSPRSDLSCKRDALESELIVSDVHCVEQKRRKVQGFSIERSETSGFQASMSNGGPTEGAVGFSAGEPPVPKLALIESAQVEYEDPLANGLPNVGGGAWETRSKKRACLTEVIKLDQSSELLDTRIIDDGSPSRDGPMEHEPRSKKSRVISNEASCLSDGKSRKSLTTVQESSRKKVSTPSKNGNLKQAKKGATLVKKSASHAKKGKKSRTPGRAGVRLEVLLSAPGKIRDPNLPDVQLTRKRTLLSWLIDNGTVAEHEKVRYLHRIHLHCMLTGLVTRDGILCDCCKKVVTLSVFEAHAGSKLHRPSANIFLSDGRSLSSCQVEALAMKTQNETDAQRILAEQGTDDKSDDTCGVCGDGGDLICCDHCPSTFHISCMGLKEVPDGDWYCPNCRCASCGGSQFNGDQATFNDLTVIFCDQCECEYHVKCLRERGFSLNSLPQDNFFCGDSCGKIYQGLQDLVGSCNPMEDGFSWTLLRSRADDDLKAGRHANLEINAEHDSKLSIALSVMHECFRPMIDPRTKIDIISHVLYNRRSDVSRLNYHGFYTMLLERGDELISVATIRVHGARLAEMPLIGTRFAYRRQGMCRRLMGAIEEMLFTLGVERLVLPAVEELLKTWIGYFHYRPMDESQRLELMDLNIMAFPGTSILYKELDGSKLAFDEPLQPMPALAIGQSTRCSESPVASPPVTVKRGRGRPPKNKEARLKAGDGVAVAVVRANELAEAGRDATCSPTSQGFLGKALGLARPSKDGDDVQEIEALPTVLRRKRGRPARARVTFNSSDGVLSTTGTSVQIDQLAIFSGGQVQQSFAAREPKVEEIDFTPSERLSGGGLLLIGEKEGDEPDNSLAIQTTTTRYLSEVECGNEEGNLVPGTTQTQERSCKTLALARLCHDIPSLESSATGSTKTYERRKAKLSPPSLSRIQGDGSEREPTYGPSDFFSDDVEVAAEPGFRYPEVSVPIRTFPSQFASQGDHNPPGTFIPVETIVVNSGPKVEPVDELTVPQSEERLVEPSDSERDELRNGSKVLLRLKFSKKSKSPQGTGDTEDPQPSSTSIAFCNGGLLPPSAYTVSDLSKDVQCFEQFDQGQLKQSDSSIGPHCMKVTVS